MNRGSTDIALYLFLGLVAGVFSGLIGVGGGIIIVPALILLFGMSQHQAPGTTLALLVPPIGLRRMDILHARVVDLRIATFICGSSGNRVGHGIICHCGICIVGALLAAPFSGSEAWLGRASPSTGSGQALPRRGS